MLGLAIEAPSIFVFENEVRRVRCYDTEFFGKSDDFVLEFAAFAVQADIIEQVCNFAVGPQARDKVAIFVGVGEAAFEHVAFGASVDVPAQGDGTVAFASITAKEQDLASTEQVGELFGVGVDDADTATNSKLNVAEDGVADFVIKPANALFDVFAWFDIIACPAGFLGHFVEKFDVNGVANAKGKDTGFVFVGFFDVLEDGGWVGFADGWVSISDHHDDVDALSFGCLAKSLLHGLVNGGTTGCFESFDELECSLDVAAIGLLQASREQPFDICGEANDIEVVFWIEFFDTSSECAFGPFYAFVCGHRAGCIEDKCDIFAHEFFGAIRDFGCGHH